MFKLWLLTMIILLIVPGLLFALMFVLILQGINVDVIGWSTMTIALTIAAELYGISKYA